MERRFLRTSRFSQRFAKECQIVRSLEVAADRLVEGNAFASFLERERRQNKSREEESSTKQAQLRGDQTPKMRNDVREQVSLNVNRRRMLKGAGIVLGASGALAALAAPLGAAGEDEDRDRDAINGLWAGVVSTADNSFPPFKALSLFGGGLFIASGTRI